MSDTELIDSTIAWLRCCAVLRCGAPALSEQGRATDNPRVSGQVEATEVQVAPEVGGRVLEIPVVEGDRVEEGRCDRHARYARRRSGAAARAGRARAGADAQLRLLQAGSRPEDIRQARGAGDGGRRATWPRRRPSWRPPRRTFSDSSSCCRTTPARRSSATMRRREGMWRRDRRGVGAGAREPRRERPWRG